MKVEITGLFGNIKRSYNTKLNRAFHCGIDGARRFKNYHASVTILLFTYLCLQN